MPEPKRYRLTVEMPTLDYRGGACPECGDGGALASVYRDGGYWRYCTRCRTGKWRNPLLWDFTVQPPRRLSWEEGRARRAAERRGDGRTERVDG